MEELNVAHLSLNTHFPHPPHSLLAGTTNTMMHTVWLDDDEADEDLHVSGTGNSGPSSPVASGGGITRVRTTQNSARCLQHCMSRP